MRVVIREYCIVYDVAITSLSYAFTSHPTQTIILYYTYNSQCEQICWLILYTLTYKVFARRTADFYSKTGTWTKNDFRNIIHFIFVTQMSVCVIRVHNIIYKNSMIFDTALRVIILLSVFVINCIRFLTTKRRII